MLHLADLDRILTMALSAEKSSNSGESKKHAGLPFSNGVKPQHILILVVTLLIRYYPLDPSFSPDIVYYSQEHRNERLFMILVQL